MRESLRSDVFPLVPRCQPYFQAWRNREGVYDLYADDWVPPEWATVEGDDSSDAAAHRSIFDHRRLLAPGGVYAMVGGSMGSLLRALAFGPLLSRAGRRRMGILAIQPGKEDLATAADLVERGDLRCVIDRRYALAEAAEGLRRLSAGEARGKIVVTMSGRKSGPRQRR